MHQPLKLGNCIAKLYARAGKRFLEKMGLTLAREEHLRGFTLCSPFPLNESLGIRSGDVLFRGYFQPPGDRVYPFGRPLDFTKIPNRCFINHHLAGIVGPLGAVFFIAKARPKAKLMENLSQDMAPFNRRLNLPARLMPAFFTLVLVSQGPF